MDQPKADTPPFQKEVIKLPDGRELTYYRFPDAATSGNGKEPAGGSRGPRTGKER